MMAAPNLSLIMDSIIDAEFETVVPAKRSEPLSPRAVAEFPAAQKTLAAIDGTDRPPLRSHLLLIAVLMKLLGETSGITRGLQSEILGKISEMKWSVLGLRKTNIERMLAAANKAASHHDLR